MIKTLDDILLALQVAAGVAGMYPPAAVPAALAAKLLAIVQAGIDAHTAATGQPWNAALLAPLPLVPATPSPIPPQ